MPFAFTWTNTDPADPTAANLLGKDIRDLRAAIQERMDAVFTDPTGTWAASDPTHPIVPAANIISAASKVIAIHHSAFEPDTYYTTSGGAKSTVSRTQQYIQVDMGGGVFGPYTRTLYAPLVFAESPSAVTITLASFRVDIASLGTAMACRLCSEDVNTQAVTVLGTVNAANAAGVQQLAIAGAFNTGVILGIAQQFFLQIDITFPNPTTGTSPKVYGAFINYTCPDGRATV